MKQKHAHGLAPQCDTYKLTVVASFLQSRSRSITSPACNSSHDLTAASKAERVRVVTSFWHIEACILEGQQQAEA